MTPDFVVIGHVVRDVVPGGWRVGGTVTFAAVQAHRLGLTVGVVTRAAADIDTASELPFAEVVQRQSRVTTSFENVYDGGRRRQRVLAHSDPIDRADVPASWRSAPIALIGPVLGEVEPRMARFFESASIVGVSAQGWLRSLDADGRVVQSSWDGDPYWDGADVVFASDEDLGGGDRSIDAWMRDVGVVAMTESWRGARVYSGGQWRRMDAFPETEVDPTGAGDTFATAFLVRLRENADVDDAARFGAAAASLSVGGVAAAAIPTRAEIELRLAQYPEVTLG
jgi:sugar/nucleoside kinase (ribokinase family)